MTILFHKYLKYIPENSLECIQINFDLVMSHYLTDYFKMTYVLSNTPNLCRNFVSVVKYSSFLRRILLGNDVISESSGSYKKHSQNKHFDLFFFFNCFVDIIMDRKCNLPSLLFLYEKKKLL